MKLQVKIEDQVYDVEVEDLSSRPVRASIDGEVFEVWPEETATPAVAMPVAAPVVASAPAAPRPAPVAAAAPAPAGSNTVTAPLPGVVTVIKAKVGDSVKQGQEVLGLEAMKMNNAIRATRAGKISAIHVNVGDHVKHGQSLFDLGD
jgi:biotin carboxyl carrier protein